MKLKICIVFSLLFLIKPLDDLNAQCDTLENYFGPIFTMEAPVFNNIPILVPDQDIRSVPGCESSSDGIDPGEYFDLTTQNYDYKIFTVSASGVDVYDHLGNLTDGAEVASFSGVEGVTYHVVDEINVCDIDAAPNILVKNEQIYIECTSCPEIPTMLPPAVLNSGLDSFYISNPEFVAFSNYPTAIDPLGSLPWPKERDV